MWSLDGSNTIGLRKQTLPPVKTSRVAITHAAEDENEPLSPMARLFHKPECNLHIIAIIGSKTRVDVEHFKSVLPDTLLKHPRFCSSQGLMIHVTTYMDKLTFILSVDDETVPDPYLLCDDLEESVTLIKDAAMVDEKLSLRKY